jgi:hypothetical protein
MSTIFILIQIKFDIDIDNDELWKAYEKKKKKSWLSVRSNMKPK